MLVSRFHDTSISEALFSSIQVVNCLLQVPVKERTARKREQQVSHPENGVAQNDDSSVTQALLTQEPRSTQQTEPC